MLKPRSQYVVLWLVSLSTGSMSVVGLIDGLICRDLRRFEAAPESGIVYHCARRMISCSLIARGLVWLAVPFFCTRECVYISGGSDWTDSIHYRRIF
ncbi:DUF4400 domain-containing protein [Pantoea agglomerans]|uniref:DUF4400 domain-containing protein n=2 Tax=Enterobacter agglomerans TaxID=549 RepID=UPI003D17A523